MNKGYKFKKNYLKASWKRRYHERSHFSHNNPSFIYPLCPHQPPKKKLFHIHTEPCVIPIEISRRCNFPTRFARSSSSTAMECKTRVQRERMQPSSNISDVNGFRWRGAAWRLIFQAHRNCAEQTPALPLGRHILPRVVNSHEFIGTRTDVYIERRIMRARTLYVYIPIYSAYKVYTYSAPNIAIYVRSLCTNVGEAAVDNAVSLYILCNLAAIDAYSGSCQDEFSPLVWFCLGDEFVMPRGSIVWSFRLCVIYGELELSQNLGTKCSEL